MCANNICDVFDYVNEYMDGLEVLSEMDILDPEIQLVEAGGFGKMKDRGAILGATDAGRLARARIDVDILDYKIKPVDPKLFNFDKRYWAIEYHVLADPTHENASHRGVIIVNRATKKIRWAYCNCKDFMFRCYWVYVRNGLSSYNLPSSMSQIKSKVPVVKRAPVETNPSNTLFACKHLAKILTDVVGMTGLSRVASAHMKRWGTMYDLPKKNVDVNHMPPEHGDKEDYEKPDYDEDGYESEQPMEVPDTKPPIEPYDDDGKSPKVDKVTEPSPEPPQGRADTRPVSVPDKAQSKVTEPVPVKQRARKDVRPVDTTEVPTLSPVSNKMRTPVVKKPVNVDAQKKLAAKRTQTVVDNKVKEKKAQEIHKKREVVKNTKLDNLKTFRDKSLYFGVLMCTFTV